MNKNKSVQSQRKKENKRSKTIKKKEKEELGKRKYPTMCVRKLQTAD